MPSLRGDYVEFCDQVDGLIDLCANISPLPARHRKAVAEIASLRAFDLLQGVFCSVAVKLVCGAQYLDGTNANVLLSARSKTAALASMTMHGRTKPKHKLPWSQVSEITDNCRFVIHSSDHFLTTLVFHSAIVDEMRKIRNRIAHNNAGSRTKYQLAVRQRYGASLRSIAPGTLLLTDRFTPRIIDQHLAQSKVLVKQLVKG